MGKGFLVFLRLVTRTLVTRTYPMCSYLQDSVTGNL